MDKFTKTLTFKLLEPQPDGVNKVAAILPVIPLVLILLAKLLGPAGIVDKFYWIAAVVLYVLVALMEILIFRERRILLATHLELDSDRVSCIEGTKTKWSVAWTDIESVDLLWYSVQINHYHQALVFRLKSGRNYLIPTSSHLYGKMPRVSELTKLIGRTGFEVETAYWPLSLAPGGEKERERGTGNRRR